MVTKGFVGSVENNKKVISFIRWRKDGIVYNRGRRILETL